jgi:ligand-binding sensor domain-containing protein/signal transduction histidine kinase
MKFHHFQLVCLLILFSCRMASAQPTVEKVKFSRMEVGSGLSNSNVTCILQDSKGFLWFGTQDGLNKFDGYNFKVYRNNPDDTASLLTNAINCIFEDSQKKIWVSTRSGGLQYYDNKLDRFVRISEFSTNTHILQITEDDNNNVWITGNRYLDAFVAQLDRSTGKWKNFILFPSKEPVESLLKESEDEFWLGVRRGGFLKWNKRTNTVKRYLHDPENSESPACFDIHQILKDTNGYLWIASSEGLSKFEIKSEKFTNFTANPSSPGSLLVNPIRQITWADGRLLLATENGGLSRMDTTTNQFTNFLFDKNDPNSLSDNSVWSVYRDHQNRIWIGTFSKGLCVIDKLQNKFSQLDIVLENDIVNAIYQDHKERIWIGTEGGIVRKDGNRVRYYKHEPDQKGSLSSDPILSTYEDSQNRMWFGTWAGGLNRYDEKTERFISYLPDDKNAKSLSDPNVYSIREYSKTKELLVSSYKGLNILTDEKNGIFENYKEGENGANNYIRSIYEDSNGNIWLGTIEELDVYDTQNKKIIRFDSRTNKKEIRTSKIVNCILEDKKKRLWVATTIGLELIIDKKFIKRFTTKDGLPNNIVNGILEDNKGNLWLSSTEGISKFNPDNKTIQNYNVSDGLLGNEFKPNACFKSKDGLFFFGGKGVNVFDPDNIQQNPYVPPVYITDFKIFNKSVTIGEKDSLLKSHIGEVQEIYLPYQYTVFSLEFAALNFSSSNKNRYAYKLENFESDWNDVGNQRSATFTNLDAGTYTFRVKASNNDGLWNETGASLIIHILPPFWKTWWFKTMIGLLIVGLAIAYYKIRVHAVEQQNKKLESLVAKRTEELEQTNEELVNRDEEIRTQNNELFNQREELASQNEELQSARQVIEKQNNEIKLRNESLEEEIKDRTKDLVEYNQQLEQFAFITAHNLRAPVARILGLGNVLEFASKSAQDERLIIGKLIFATGELDTVVKDLSTILELRKNNISLITEVSLHEELRLIKENLEKEILETNAAIEEDFSKAPSIRTIKPYLDSILINLISNAIKYRHLDRRPLIQIKSEVIENKICLTVSDNGIGIDLSSYGDKLFTLYSRFHNHVEGKGMGLYLVKTQVVALGGKIEVESEIDRGTTFRILF